MAELRGGVLSRDVLQTTELSAVMFFMKAVFTEFEQQTRLRDPEIAYIAIEECSWQSALL